MRAIDVRFRLDRSRNATVQVFEHLRAQTARTRISSACRWRWKSRGCLEAGNLENVTRIDMDYHVRMYEASELPDLWAMMRRCSGTLQALDVLRARFFPT